MQRQDDLERTIIDDGSHSPEEIVMSYRAPNRLKLPADSGSAPVRADSLCVAPLMVAREKYLATEPAISVLFRPKYMRILD
mmetsp:Transcript_35372/g.74069  ORF Transcript_35372/g.74069 Transcript_35372/m.74069 type:complete len:81 (-) Transcript_35372:319-561(-)